jgi:hypothetical protein
LSRYLERRYDYIPLRKTVDTSFLFGDFKYLNPDVPILFIWGTLCRRAIIDRDNGDCSLISIIPAELRVQGAFTRLFNETQSTEYPPGGYLSLGPVTAVCNFRKRTPLKEKVDVQLQIEISIPRLNRQTLSQELNIPSNSGHGISILRFDEVTYPIFRTDSFPIEDLIQVNYKFEDTVLGSLEIPLIIDDTSG